MQILLLRSSTGVFGAERMILELAAGLANRGIEPVIGVIGNRNPASKELATYAAEQGLKTELFECQGPFDLKTALSIRRFLKANGIELVHAHGYKANFYAVASSFLTRYRCLATCHPWTEVTYSRRARLYTALDKLLLRRMVRISAVSDAVRQEVLQALPGMACEVIPNGIEVQRFAHSDTAGLRKKLGLSDNHEIIGTVGRLVPEKGIDYLIESMAIIKQERPDARLVIVGDGPMRYGLEKLVRERGLETKIVFAGVRDDVPDLMALFDVFVLASVSEGLPMVILEAMAAGRAIVATSVGDIPKVVHHGSSGFVVRPRDVTGLAVAIRTLLDDPERAHELGCTAQQQVKERFSSQAMADKYLAQYEAILNPNHRSP